VLQRAERAGIAVPLPVALPPESTPPEGTPPKLMPPEQVASAAQPDPRAVQALGATLLGVVADARASGLDAEAALRMITLAYADAVRAAEPQADAAAEPPSATD
jgi:XTP/dITP diphosphohydrolase